jgi:hypothetical protein
MLAHLRARGAFTDTPEPALLADPAPARGPTARTPGWFAALAARRLRPLRPSVAFGLGGLCTAGLAFLVVMRDPAAGSRPSPSGTTRIVTAVPDTSPGAAAAPTGGTSEAEHLHQRSSAELQLAELARLRADAEKKSRELERLRQALRAQPAPLLPKPAAMPAPALPSKAADTSEAGGAAQLQKGAALALSPQTPTVAGVALERLFDPGTATLNEAGREWLRTRVMHHPPPPHGSGEPVYLSIRLARPLGNGSFALDEMTQQRLRSAGAYLDGLKAIGGGTVKSRILFDGKYGIAIPQVGTEVGRDRPLPDNTPLLWLEFEPGPAPGSGP